MSASSSLAGPPHRGGRGAPPIDGKTDQPARGALGAGQCSKRISIRTSTGYTGETGCRIAPIPAAGTGVITGGFAGKVQMDVDTTPTGMPGTKEPVRRKMAIDATHLGPCEADRARATSSCRTGRS